MISNYKVNELKETQKSGKFHPMTCKCGGGNLIPTNYNWMCSNCNYTSEYNEILHTLIFKNGIYYYKGLGCVKIDSEYIIDTDNLIDEIDTFKVYKSDTIYLVGRVKSGFLKLKVI
jgi:hypothetical protein